MVLKCFFRKKNDYMRRERRRKHPNLFGQILLWGHILPYPKDGLVQPKHIRRA